MSLISQRALFCSVSFLAFVFSPGLGLAQADRYELGRRMKLFEAEWEKQTDAAGRKRAAEALGPVMQKFFTFQFAEAGRTLDAARFTLGGKDIPPEARRWAEAVSLAASSRLIDANEKQLTVTIALFYKPDAARTEKASFQLRFRPDDRPQEVLVPRFPAKVEIQLPPVKAGVDEDLTLTLSVLVEGQVRAESRQTISRVSRLKDRLAVLKKAAANKTDPPTIESATFVEHVDWLEKLADGQTLETDHPAARLLVEAEAIAKAGFDKPYFNTNRSGQMWLSVPTAKDKTTHCRILVPKGLVPTKPVPIVVALHGAGGSENLFFEGYGDGMVANECEKRGWLMMSPRSPLSFTGGGPPVGDIVDALAKRYPIDPKRVLLVGHSMGAVQTIDAVQAYPGKFAAAAALGGGGRMRKPEHFRELPVLIGVGAQDFARGAAKSLHKALVDNKCEKAIFREYPDIEHILIVRQALPDIFALFDKLPPTEE